MFDFLPTSSREEATYTQPSHTERLQLLNKIPKAEMPARTTGRTGLITEDKICNAAWPPLSRRGEREVRSYSPRIRAYLYGHEPRLRYILLLIWKNKSLALY